MNEKENNPLVSVVMAEYNTDISQFEESILSIINQTYKNFELIIVDDCGKNDVKDMVEKFNDKRIIVLKNKKNSGLATSLNNALKVAKGEYIMRMDTDDIAINNRFELQIKFANSHPEYSLIGSRHTIFDENGEYEISNIVGEIDKNKFIRGTPFCHPSLLIRKKALIDIGGYPLYNRAQDYAMEMNMYAKGYKGYIMNEVLLKYRQYANSYKKRNLKAKFEETKIRARYFKILKMPLYSYIYILKPLVVAIIPNYVLKKLNKK